MLTSNACWNAQPTSILLTTAQLFLLICVIPKRLRPVIPNPQSMLAIPVPRRISPELAVPVPRVSGLGTAPVIIIHTIFEQYAFTVVAVGVLVTCPLTYIERTLGGRRYGFLRILGGNEVAVMEDLDSWLGGTSRRGRIQLC